MKCPFPWPRADERSPPSTLYRQILPAEAERATGFWRRVNPSGWREARSPSPGTPGEGGVRVFLRRLAEDPHPNPLPGYRERERGPTGVLPGSRPREHGDVPYP